MGKLVEADEILVEFLQSEIIEPERYVYNKSTNAITRFTKRHITKRETFSGDGSTVRFTLTSTKLFCVRTVEVGGTTKVKYQDYEIDLDNNQIIFGTAPTAGGDNIMVEYDYHTTGTTWIYTDMPRMDLNIDSFPRIAVVSLTESGGPIGMFDTDFLDDLTFQIDILTKKNLFIEFYGGETTQTVDRGIGGISNADITLR